MIKSMTGFGIAENLQGNRKFTVEMKAVNHRYFDVTIKMPKKLSFFESAIRTFLKNYIQRGKVDVFITYEDFTEENVSLKYNEAIAAQYLKYYRQMTETFGLRDDISVSALGRCPEVFTMEEQTVDEKEIWAVLESALKEACEKFVESRITEGGRGCDRRPLSADYGRIPGEADHESRGTAWGCADGRRKDCCRSNSFC